MTDCIQHSFNLLTSLLALVLAMGQLAIRNKNKSNYYYAFSFISIFIWSFCDTADYFFPILNSPVLSRALDIVFKTAYSLTAVLLYFLMKSIFHKDFVLRGRILLLFIPGLITMLVLNVTNLLSAQKYYSVSKIVSFTLYTFSIILYVFIIHNFNFLRKFSTNDKNRTTILKIMIFLSVFAIISIFQAFSPASVNDNYLLMIMIILFYIITMRYPEVFILLREEAEKAQYAKSKIHKLNIEKVRMDIESKLIGEKLFLQSDLTLKDLATHVGITPHQLSEILNVYYKKNFYDFINFYRIEEAKKIFSIDKTATALGICFQVGFNSNSSFYRAFKKETDISPVKYRNNLAD